MKKSFLFITDTFSSLNHKKDTSIFMMEEALNEGVDVYQCEMKNIFAKTFKTFFKNDLKHVFGKMSESSLIAVFSLVCTR